MADNRITASTTDDELRKHTMILCYRLGGGPDLIAYILCLERRIAKLESSNTPGHLQTLEKR
jgi:hypothetical protein